MKIGKYIIERKPLTKTPFLIAEIGVNYYDIAKEKNLDLMDACKLMIDEAIQSGVDAVKFQTYKASTLASIYAKSYWDTSKEPTRNQHDLFSKFDRLNNEDYEELQNYTIKKGGMFLTTCFDHESVNYFGDKLDAFKIASADITNYPLIDQILKYNKPLLFSTGASSLSEIFSLQYYLQKRNFDFDKLAFLHCVLEYPTPPSHANLRRISLFHEILPKSLVIGYSDHVTVDKSMLTLTSAWMLGANILEKHFTLDKTLVGNDHYHAMDPQDIKNFKKNTDFLQKLFEMDEPNYLPSEEISRQNARRSMIAARDILPDEILDESNIIFKRPGTGISPIFWDEIINSKTKSMRLIKQDEIIQWENISFIKEE